MRECTLLSLVATIGLLSITACDIQRSSTTSNPRGYAAAPAGGPRTMSNPGGYTAAPTEGNAAAGPAHGQLPADARYALDQYILILRQSRSIDECAGRFLGIAGGSLLNSSGTQLRQDVPQMSLKKDYNNIRFYADPPILTRVDYTPDASDGYGATAIRGRMYKVWIAKAQGQSGMPAPISILIPVGHPNIHDPKIIGIGSL